MLEVAIIYWLLQIIYSAALPFVMKLFIRIRKLECIRVYLSFM